VVKRNPAIAIAYFKAAATFLFLVSVLFKAKAFIAKTPDYRFPPGSVRGQNFQRSNAQHESPLSHPKIPTSQVETHYVFSNLPLSSSPRFSLNSGRQSARRSTDFFDSKRGCPGHLPATDPQPHRESFLVGLYVV
jgi:hypothetical protein